MRFSLFTMIAGASEVEQALESVVTVDHATVQVVEVGRGETATVKLDHRAQIGRNDRNDVQDHVRGAVAALQEGVNDLEALNGLLALLLLGVLVGDDGLELLGLGREVDGSEQVADGLGTHATLEVHGVVTGHLTEQRLIGNEVALAELHEGVEGVRAELLLVLALFLDVDDARGDLLGGQRLLVGELVKVLGGCPCSLRDSIWRAHSASISSRSAASSSRRSSASASRAS